MGFSLYFSSEGSAKLQWVGGGGGGGHLIFRVPLSSFRVRRNSVGCSESQKDAA